MSQEKNTRLLAADAAGVSAGGGNFARGRAGRFSDRDRLRARRRRDRRPRRGGHLRGQGPPEFQSAHRPCRRYGAGEAGRAFRPPRRKTGGGILAGAAHAGAAAGRNGAKPAIWRAPDSRVHRPAHARRNTVARRNCWRGAGGPSPRLRPILSGHVSPATPAHVLADLDGRIDAVLDGGACPVGVESTIVACLMTRRACCGRAAFRDALERSWVASLRARRATAQNPRAGPARLPLRAARKACGSMQKTCATGEAGLDFGGQFSGAARYRPFAA